MFIFGQQDPNFYTRPTTYPVAPNAFEFVKYGEIPVSKYTGVPNISIPIYTIDAGPNDLKIPISLTYHSNGFRVNEEAGWTGLGWTLNGGGTITQIVNGYDDFKTQHPNRELPNMNQLLHHSSGGSGGSTIFDQSINTSGQHFTILEDCFFGLPYQGGYDPCGGVSQYNGGAYFPSPINQTYSLNNGNVQPIFGVGVVYDYQPDVFSFNFLGYNGKFVLDWETNTFKCLTDPKIKVEKDLNTHKKITITTPDGNIFKFSMKDESINRHCSDVTINPPPGPNYKCEDAITDLVYGKGNEFAYEGATSRIYKLDKIYTNKGREIEYLYERTGFIRGFESIGNNDFLNVFLFYS